MHWTFYTCMIKSVSGRFGDIVCVSRNGGWHVRPYVKPRNPDTAKQRMRRSAFAEAVHAWRSLSPEEKSAWNAKARRLNRTGYNLYISRHMLAVVTAPVVAKNPRGTAFIMRRNGEEYRTLRPAAIIVRNVYQTGNRETSNRASPHERAA